MSYETVIEQVKMLPELLLASVSTFIKLLEAEQCNFTENLAGHAKQKTNKLFCINGKIHLDQNAVTELREVSLI